jgi:hypothetical protein
MIEHVPTPPFAPKPNTDSSTRGHDDQRLGSGIVCLTCRARKPRKGGWDKNCDGDRRAFMGG